MVPYVNVQRKSSATSKHLAERLKKVSRKAVYVGIPASSARYRSSSLLDMAGKITGKGKKSAKRKAKLLSAALDDVSNAELLHIFSKGSPLRNQPARPVLEPAIEADGNRQIVAVELAGASRAVLDGKPEEAKRQMRRAGIAGQNAARGWFTDSRNGWAKNSPSTVAAKGSDRPGIDTGAMRQAITYVMDGDDS